MPAIPPKIPLDRDPPESQCVVPVIRVLQSPNCLAINIPSRLFVSLGVLALAALPPLLAQSGIAKPPANPQASVRLPTSALPGFALIPAGEFTMGDALDGDAKARPHKVNVSAFQIQTKEVTKAQWDEVRAWGLRHGYTDLPPGAGKAADHPVLEVSWQDVVKWCNAKSEMDGFTPCYFTDASKTTVHRKGNRNISPKMVKWNAKGYRLPTEAEWEKAARGGLHGNRFPWGDTISHAQANFRNEGLAPYQTGSTAYHPDYKTGELPYTSPVASFKANNYGLYDMTGNVWEWCWDWHAPYPVTLQSNPCGALSGTYRVFRGGGWDYDAKFLSCSFRGNYWADTARYDNLGFRLAMTLP